jgi:hypothetical protein
MNTVKFLTASTDSPRGAEVKKMTLPVPNPQENEYRRFYNHRDEESEEVKTDEDSGEPVVVSVTIPVADYVSVQADHEPTDEEWREVLSENGFSDEEIDKILLGD